MRIQYYFLLLGLVYLVVFYACEKEDLPNRLIPVHTYDLEVDELSGLCYAGAGILYTVSDQTNRIYKISDKGRILATLPFLGSDLEGISYNPDKRTLWVVQERNRDVLELDLSGEIIQQVNLTIESNYLNNGLEGISVNPLNNHVFVANEKNPKLLVELDDKLQKVREFTSQHLLDFSGVCMNPDGNELWVLSDESQKVCRFDLQGNCLSEYNLTVLKAEGLAIDFSEKRMFIISDLYPKLFEYELPEIEP